MAEGERLTDEEADELLMSLRAYTASQTGKFDRSAVLIAGGAFTVSATLLKPGDWHWTVGVAWFFWAVCLLCSCGGYLLSDWQGMKLIRRLEGGDRQHSQLPIERHRKRISIINGTTFVTLVLGVIFFGWFAIQRGIHDSRQEETLSVQANQEVQNAGQVQTRSEPPTPTKQDPGRVRQDLHPGLPDKGRSGTGPTGEEAAEARADRRDTQPSHPAD